MLLNGGSVDESTRKAPALRLSPFKLGTVFVRYCLLIKAIRSRKQIGSCREFMNDRVILIMMVIMDPTTALYFAL